MCVPMCSRRNAERFIFFSFLKCPSHIVLFYERKTNIVAATVWLVLMIYHYVVEIVLFFRQKGNSFDRQKRRVNNVKLMICRGNLSK